MRRSAFAGASGGLPERTSLDGRLASECLPSPCWPLRLVAFASDSYSVGLVQVESLDQILFQSVGRLVLLVMVGCGGATVLQGPHAEASWFDCDDFVEALGSLVGVNADTEVGSGVDGRYLRGLLLD